MPRRPFLRTSGAAALLAIAAFAGSAHAQSAFQRDRNVTVRDRPRPDYDAIGLRAGAFLVFPKAELSVAHSDNVFAEETNPRSDWVTSFAPSVLIESQWARHALNARLSANAFRYSKYDDNSSTTLSSQLNGRLDVVQGTAITGSLGFDRLVEPRSSASSPFGALEPVRYNQTSADVGFSREVNQIRVSGAVHYRNYLFDNVGTSSGVVIDQKYRNNTSWEEQLRFDYALSPAVALFVNGTHNNWSFKAPTNRLDVVRDASGFAITTGADFEITSLTRGQFQVGILDQNYEDPRVPDSSGLSLSGRVEYFPTQLLTVTLNAERLAQSTGVIGAGGVVHTNFGVQGDYELLRNLILTARLQYFNDGYRGVDRQDKIWAGTLGANYLVNRWLGINLLYSRYDQNSSGLQRGRDFVDNRVQLGLVAQY